MAVSKLPESFTWSAPAAVDLSAKLHYLARVTSAGLIDLCADGGPCIGNIYEADIADRAISVQFGGIGKVIAAETIDEGAVIASDTNGKAVNAAVGDWIVGIAISPASANGIFSFIHTGGRRSA
jgi:hypothetical protein